MKGLIKAVLIMTSCRVFSPNYPTKRRGTLCQMDALLGASQQLTPIWLLQLCQYRGAEEIEKPMFFCGTIILN